MKTNDYISDEFGEQIEVRKRMKRTVDLVLTGGTKPYSRFYRWKRSDCAAYLRGLHFRRKRRSVAQKSVTNGNTLPHKA